ncbi:MAG TPA: RHS repeat-associated core domain-containing protein [Thermoanaerobaculia bacterium]|jgi:RHS repeat-associated protein
MTTYNGGSYFYSDHGELQKKIDAQGTTLYNYDVLGNLRSVTLPDGRLIEYVIDASNRRVGKKVNGTLTTGWIYGDQLRIIAETDGSGTITKRFVYGSRTNVPDYMTWQGSTYRIIADHLGSPRYVLQATTGTLAEALTYDEFGNVLSDSNPGFVPFGFAGGLYDRDTGLMRFGARDFDSSTGRWTSNDPIGFGGSDSNLYEYVVNDPINQRDPSGLEKLNFLPSGDPNNRAAATDPDPNDAILINSHGSNQTVNHMTANQLARRIKKEAKTWKRGRKIILNSCNAARGDNSIAQRLSKILRTTVIGADQPVWSLGPVDLGTWGTWGASGGDKHGGGPDFTTRGHWVTFVNGKRMNTEDYRDDDDSDDE